jgi:hypothetical protein
MPAREHFSFSMGAFFQNLVISVVNGIDPPGFVRREPASDFQTKTRPFLDRNWTGFVGIL